MYKSLVFYLQFRSGVITVLVIYCVKQYNIYGDVLFQPNFNTSTDQE